MALYKKQILLFVALFAAHLIFAEDSSNSTDSGSNSGSENGDRENSSSRTFFFTRFIGCNYTEQAGRSCYGCRQTLVCTQNNLGVLRRCHGFLPYCNGGRCSYIPGPACNSTG